MRKTAAVLCAAMLALTACGNGEDDEAKENIKASVLDQESQVAGGTELTEEQAECFADGLVDEIGTEKLQEYGLLNEDNEIAENANPTDMEEGDAEAMADTIVDCVDMKQMIEDQVNTSAQTDLTEKQAECLSDAIDEDAIKAGLAASFQGETTNPMEEMQGEMMACVMGGTGSGDEEMQME